MRRVRSIFQETDGTVFLASTAKGKSSRRTMSGPSAQLCWAGEGSDGNYAALTTCDWRESLQGYRGVPRYGLMHACEDHPAGLGADCAGLGDNGADGDAGWRHHRELRSRQ